MSILKNIIAMNKKSILKQYLIILLLCCIAACTGKLSEKEILNIEKYTKYEAHDSALQGKWMNEKTCQHAGKVSKIALSFDEKGINNERMYVEEEPFNDWHMMYYYYTRDGKIFFYRPAEKGFLAMDGEIFSEYDYKISDDGESLTIGDDTYTKIK